MPVTGQLGTLILHTCCFPGRTGLHITRDYLQTVHRPFTITLAPLHSPVQTSPLRTTQFFCFWLLTVNKPLSLHSSPQNPYSPSRPLLPKLKLTRVIPYTLRLTLALVSQVVSFDDASHTLILAHSNNCLPRAFSFIFQINPVLNPLLSDLPLHQSFAVTRFQTFQFNHHSVLSLTLFHWFSCLALYCLFYISYHILPFTFVLFWSFCFLLVHFLFPFIFNFSLSLVLSYFFIPSNILPLRNHLLPLFTHTFFLSMVQPSTAPFAYHSPQIYTHRGPDQQ